MWWKRNGVLGLIKLPRIFLFNVKYKNKRLKNIYAQLSSSNDFKNDTFEKMISHQLIYLSKGKRTYNIEKYINWLTQKNTIGINDK